MGDGQPTDDGRGIPPHGDVELRDGDEVVAVLEPIEGTGHA